MAGTRAHDSEVVVQDDWNAFLACNAAKLAKTAQDAGWQSGLAEPLAGGVRIPE
jgi:hypothetical protein